jgi:hypothetical protein
MALATDLMGAGEAWPLAEKLGYTPQTLAAAGTTQTNAAVATSKCIEMTATGADGILLPNVDVGTPCWVFNSSGSTGLVYVPSGHTLNTSLNGSLSLTTHKLACFVQYKNKFWGSILSA